MKSRRAITSTLNKLQIASLTTARKAMENHPAQPLLKKLFQQYQHSVAECEEMDP